MTNREDLIAEWRKEVTQEEWDAYLVRWNEKYERPEPCSPSD